MNKTASKVLFVRYACWFVTVLLMVFIFLKSNEPGDESLQTSGAFTDGILRLFLKGYADMSDSEKTAYIEGLQFFVRKLAHFSVYLAMGVSSFFALLTYRCRLVLKYAVCLCLCLLYAASDEFHQCFVVGRSPQFSDVLLDFCGSLTGVILTTLIISAVMAVVKRRNQSHGRG